MNEKVREDEGVKKLRWRGQKSGRQIERTKEIMLKRTKEILITKYLNKEIEKGR